jgi:NADH dehydrogenase
LQPVYVGDVAEAAAKALATPVSQGKTYELGGPRAYPYKELLRLVLAATGRKRLLIPVPYLVWDILALLMSRLPRAPVSRDQVTLMKRDNVVAADALTLADLGIAPTSVEAILPCYGR